MATISSIALVLAGLCAAYFALFSGTSGRFVPSSLIWLAAAAYNLALAGAACMEAQVLVAALALIEIAALAILVILGVRIMQAASLARRSMQPAAWIVVLGARVNGNKPCRLLRRRLDAAYEYWQQHPDAKIVASGGKGPGEDYPEAQVMRDYLIQRGIPAEHIVCENESASTRQNLQKSSTFVEKSVPTGIVTNDFHCLRALRIAQSCKLDAFAIPAESTPSTLPHYLVREAAALVKEMLAKS